MRRRRKEVLDTQPRTAAFCFFFLRVLLFANARQVSTRSSRRSVELSGVEDVDGEKCIPSQTLSSSALRFLAATSSSFLRASRPSLARLSLIALMVEQSAQKTVLLMHYAVKNVLASPNLLINKHFFGLCSHADFERRVPYFSQFGIAVSQRGR